MTCHVQLPEHVWRSQPVRIRDRRASSQSYRTAVYLFDFKMSHPQCGKIVVNTDKLTLAWIEKTLQHELWVVLSFIRRPRERSSASAQVKVARGAFDSDACETTCGCLDRRGNAISVSSALLILFPPFHYIVVSWGGYRDHRAPPSTSVSEEVSLTGYSTGEKSAGRVAFFFFF